MGRQEARSSTELALMRRIAAGDHRAFEEFVALADRSLRAYCGHRTRDSHEADELRQEVLVRVWTKADSFDGRSSLQTWLYRLVANLAIDGHRRRSRLPVPVAELPEPRAGGAVEPEADAVRAADVRRALARLAPHYRKVVFLADYCDLSDHDIAARCGIARTTVRTRLHRGRNALRGVLRAG
jgi:RNA polymerase sigma-70 factor (ECF subfamily)